MIINTKKGGTTPTGSLSITANGTYDVTDKASAVVNVSGGSATLQSKSVSVTANGTQTVSPDSGYDGLSSVALTVNVPTSATLQSKTVTPDAAGQTVTPDSGYDGLSSVVINGDADLVASNIKKDVEIFGVTGTYEGSGSGETYYFNGSLYYPENLVYPSTVTSMPSLLGSDFSYLESIRGDYVTTNASTYIRGQTVPILETLTFPRLATITAYVAYGVTSLQTVQFGSIGYPMDTAACALSNGCGCMKNSGGSNCTVTVYVAETALADLPSTFTNCIQGNMVSGTTFVYKNSTTDATLT